MLMCLRKPRNSGTFVVSGLTAIAAGLLVSAVARGDTVTLTSFKDNSLIETTDGSLSNGANEAIFCGRLSTAGNGKKLRSVIAFNLSVIPPGSTITSVSLTLHLIQGVGGNQTHSLYKLLKNWGEGTSYGAGGLGGPSTPNDATWIHTFYNTSLWTNPGGDFVPTVSGSTTVGVFGNFTWSSEGMKNDVQAWVNDPTTNFGWIMRGNESVIHTAKRFSSHEDVPFNQPKLVINYTLPPPQPCGGDVTDDGTVNSSDLVAVINGWGACPNPPSTCPHDVAAPYGTVNAADLLAVINSWGTCP
jgi:hypothetical protein